MSEKKKDHWGLLASLLGMAPKPEEPATPEPESAVPPEAGLVAEAIKPAVPSPPPPPPRPASRAARPEKPAPPKPAPKRRDHWGSVLGQLGVDAPYEPEPEPEPVSEPELPKPSVAEAHAEEEVETPPPPPPAARRPSHEERPGRERERSDHGRSDRDRGGRGRPAREERSARGERPAREERPRSAPPRRPHMDDDIPYDEELDSGLRELWASHEAGGVIDEPVEIEEELEIDDIEAEEVEGTAAPQPRGSHREPGAEGEERPRRRRRRRGRRGRRDEESPAASAEAPRSRPVEESDDLEADDEEPISQASPRREPPRAREDGDRSGGKRRRRRRRPETAAAAERPEADLDDDYDSEGPASVDYLSDADKAEGHKRIPTWDDAIGSIVAANLEARSRQPHPPRREGRGRR